MPESGPQLLFLVASFILFVGATTSWLPPGHILLPQQFQAAAAKFGMSNPWFDLSTVGANLRYIATLTLVRWAFVASVALWCLPVRDAVRKFAVWVFLPAGVTVTWFLFLVFTGPIPHHSLLEPESQEALDHLRAFPDRFQSLGIGFYITLVGIAALTLCLLGFRRGTISLPMRFRAEEASVAVARTDGLGKRVFSLVAAGTLATTLLSVLESLAAPQQLSNPAIRLIETWPQNFSLLVWGPSLVTAIVCAACAALLFKWAPEQGGTSANSSLALLTLGATIGAVLVICIPRIILTLPDASPFIPLAFNYGSNLPVAILGVEVPKPFLWLLVAYPIALLQEFVLRGRLQPILKRHFGLKRAILLVALLWWMLPLGFGVGPVVGLRGAWPGAQPLLVLCICIIFSVMLGWLYERTHSIIPGTAFCGAIAFFHESRDVSPYFQHPSLFWIELALILLLGWLMFWLIRPARVFLPAASHPSAPADN